MPTPNEPQKNPHLDALLAESGWVLKLAKRLARDQAAAEDIAQSTLALALERRPALDGGLRPWLAKVAGRLARRRVRGELRRQAREAVVTSARGTEADASDEVLMRFELQQDLSKRVDALPELYRRVVIYRYYEGLSVREIAAATGATPSTVRTQLARGLERIRLQYEHDTDGRSALGVFLVAAGSGTDFVARRTAEIVAMQTSTKLVAAAAVAVAAVAIFSSGLGRSERSEPSAQVVEASEEPVHASGAPPSSVSGLAVESVRPAAERSAAVADSQAPESVQVASSTVSSVRARILGQDRRPLAGATLSSVHADGRARGTNNVAYSDREGVVVLELDDASMRMWREQVFDMTFAVGAANHATQFVVHAPRLHGETDLGDLGLESGGSFVGVCVDRAGRAIAGAVLVAGPSALAESLEQLSLSGPAPDVTRPRASSAADGSFELAGIPGEFETARLWAHAPGRLWTITEPFAIAGRGRTDVGRVVLAEVPGELRIDGVVLRPDGRPAAGARVDFASLGRPFFGDVVADAQGRFLVVPKEAASMELAARDAKEEFGMSAVRMADRGDVVELRLTERRVLSITVVDVDGEPVHDVHLRPLRVDETALPAGDRLVPGADWEYTDEAGRVDIAVPGQEFLVWARKEGFGSKKSASFRHDSAPEELTITLPRGRLLSGRVLAYGEPVAGARVSASERYEDFAAMTGGFPNRYRSGAATVATDEQGYFRLPLKRGWSKLGAIARLDGMATGEIALDVPLGESVRGVEIALTEGGAIEGVVTPPSGLEAAGLYVAASRGDGHPVSAKVDAAGRYRLVGLTPGNWRVEGRLAEARTELLSTSTHPDDLEPRWNAVIVDRETLELDLDLRALGDVEVHGELRIDGAVPPPGWVVEALVPRHARASTGTLAVSLDAQGRFAFTTRPGRVELRLVGHLAGGVQVEMLRSVRLEGPRFEWAETLATAPVTEWLEGEPERARFVRGRANAGDRELSIVPVRADGVLAARVPVGESSLQVPAENAPRDTVWDVVRTVLVE